MLTRTKDSSSFNRGGTQVVLERVLRQLDRVAVPQLGTQLRHRPMPGKTSMTQPTENVPADQPARHGQGQFLLGTEGPAMIRAGRVRAVHQFTIQQKRPCQTVNAAPPMTPNVHLSATFTA